MRQAFLVPAVLAFAIGAIGCDDGNTTPPSTGGNGGGGAGGEAGQGGGGAGGEAGQGGGGAGGGAGQGGGGAGGGAMSLEEQVAAKLDAVKGDAPALRMFIEKMPKGGDLHSHTSGAVTPESLIEWGAMDGACFNQMTKFASAGPCAMGTVPMSDALNNQALYDDMLHAWSMEGFMGTLLEGHQHFFDSFGKFGAIQTDARSDDMLAQIRSTAGKNNQVYIELMQGFGSGAAGTLAESKFMMADPWDETTLLQRRLDMIADPAFTTALNTAKTNIANALGGSDMLLNCGTAMADVGCKVEVRLQVSANRTRSRAYVFGQWVFGYELAQVVPQIVGVNLVSPEENANSLLNYKDSMFALGVLRKFNSMDMARKPVHVALHAGELIPEVLPMTMEGQAHLTYHIRDAVEVAGAERIGHGADILSESAGAGFMDLLMKMSNGSVFVEINLTSNDWLLGMKAMGHPLKSYIAANVPVGLSTDDQGILRIEISDEYVRAVQEHDLGYVELKKMARATLEHSFLGGLSLWKSLDNYTVYVDECAADKPGNMPSAACDAFLMKNDKARVQWRHEADVAAFEAAAVAP
jgi:adenosine deaminase